MKSIFYLFFILFFISCGPSQKEFDELKQELAELKENESNNKSSHSAAVDLAKRYHGRAMTYFATNNATNRITILNPIITQLPCDSTLSIIDDSITSPIAS